MKLLFIHQSFPGQYRNIINALSAQNKHTIVALGINALTERIPDNVQYFQYRLSQGNTSGIHRLAMETETKVIRGEACARAANKLKSQGFTPDIICAHPGWGEALFLKDIWQNSPILSYQEFYYQSEGFDYGFDPDIQGEPSWQDLAKVRMKNAYNLLTLESSNWNITPTAFQKSTYPAHWQKFISTIHDGVNTEAAKRDESNSEVTIPDGTILSDKQQIVTFVNRSIEPYRGCHSFIRAIPYIHEKNPNARIIIIGNTKGVSYGKPCDAGEFKDMFMKEIEGKYRKSHLHFTGNVSYGTYLNILRLSSAHVYLTYPFVLSWSLLEAMSSKCPVVGSATQPVQEVVTDEKDGLLVDFFSENEIGNAVNLLLEDKKLAKHLGDNARNTIVKNYSLSTCVPRQLALIDMVASRSIGV